MTQQLSVIKVLEVSNEDGSISLLGRFSQGQWGYAVRRGKKDARTVADNKNYNSPPTDIKWMPWSKAISRLDCYSWANFSPCELHVKFQGPVLALVQERLKKQNGCQSAQKWQRLARWLDLTDV